MKLNNILHIICLCMRNETSTVKKNISFLNENEQIEIFKMDTLKYNITKHRLVSRHIGLSVDESNQFIKKYGMKLPLLLLDDPISKFYNFKLNQIIKIIRLDGIITYRIISDKK